MTVGAAAAMRRIIDIPPKGIYIMCPFHSDGLPLPATAKGVSMRFQLINGCSFVLVQLSGHAAYCIMPRFLLYGMASPGYCLSWVRFH